MVGGGWWWLVVVGGGWWWLLVVGGGWWWLVVAGGGWWWLVVVVDGGWLVVGGSWWWLVVVSSGWWFNVITLLLGRQSLMAYYSLGLFGAPRQPFICNEANKSLTPVFVKGIFGKNSNDSHDEVDSDVKNL